MNTQRLAWLFLVVLLFPAEAWSSEFDEEIEAIEDLLDLGPSSAFADIGAGSGRYALELAGRLGSGATVYATEVSTDAQDEIRTSASDADVIITVLQAHESTTGLSPGSVDAVYLRGVYHHLSHPHAITEDLFRAIRPGGRLLLIDFPPSGWLWLWRPKLDLPDREGHGIKRDVLIREIESRGFRAIREVERWPSYGFFTRDYAVLFERPSEGDSSRPSESSPSPFSAPGRSTQ